jgi:sugar (pentulose or hexulose) kinase
MTALLGIDIGTTNIKTCVYNVHGELLQDRVFPTPTTSDAYGMVYAPKEISNTVMQAIAGLNPKIKREIIALSVSSFAETMVGIDSQGKPAAGGIAWFDTRTEEQLKALQNSLDEEEVYSATGLMPHHIYSFYKLIWQREYNREIFDRIERWTSVSGYILYEFSGELTFDSSLASRTMFFHQKKGNWWEPMLQLIGITADKLAALVPSGTVLGKITAETARITGLQPDVRVVAGGHDHPCAALAVGVIRKGNALISTGTTESVTMSMEDFPLVNVRVLKKPFWWGHHCAPNRFYALNGIYSGGYAVDWLLKILGETYDVFDKLPLPRRKSLPIFFPYLRGANYKEARGAFLYMDGEVDRDVLIQSLLVGLCFELRTVWEEMSSALDLTVKEVTNAGGGTYNRYWMKLKSTVLGMDIIVPKDREGSSKGAALLAGIGCGVYMNAADAYEKTFKQDRVYSPDTALKETLDRWYPVYFELFEDLKNINKKIQSMKED